MQRVIFVKDEDGLYDRDPKRHAGARRIAKIELGELLRQLPEENILDLELYHAWSRAKNVRRVQIVNGLVRGQLSAAVRGDEVGTVITRGLP